MSLQQQKGNFSLCAGALKQKAHECVQIGVLIDLIGNSQLVFKKFGKHAIVYVRLP